MAAGNTLSKGVYTLWEENLLLDYTIEVEDEQFKVHKVIMASVSTYFKAMLTGGMLESREDRVRLEGLSAGAVSDIINFIYTNQLGEKSIASLKELLDCAVYLQATSAIDKCTVELCHKVEANNCLDMLSVFKSYSLAYGIEYTTEYIKSNITLVLSSCKKDGMSHSELLNLIDCWEWSEGSLFDTITQWIDDDYKNRKQHVNDLMIRVRFCLMEPSAIESIKLTDIFQDAAASWRDLVEEAQIYLDLPIHQKVLHESEQTQVRNEPRPVCFTADGDPHHTYALDRCNSWVEHDVYPTPLFDDWPIYAVEVNNFLVAHEEVNWQWAVFDPRTLIWCDMAGLERHKKKIALVHHGKELYVLGGMEVDASSATDAIEKYNFDTDTWQTLTSKLPVPLLQARAFSIVGSIYVVGGRMSLNTNVWSTRLDCFHPASETWETKAPMLEAKAEREIQVLELFGERIIIVLDKDFSVQYYKPSTDQWSVWRRVGAGLSKLIWDDRREDANRMVVKGNSVFMINFRQVNRGGACEKWTFCEKGLEKVESIDHVPFYTFDPHNGSSVFSFSAILQVQPVLTPTGPKP